LFLLVSSEVQAELEQSWASREQDVAALSQACEARRKSEAISEKAIGDIAKPGRAMSSAMAALGVSLGEDHVWFEDRWMVASLCDE
jgi:hypothetical protein